MDYFVTYLKSRLEFLVIFLLSGGMFGGVLFLYRLPVSVGAYPVLLSSLLWLGFGVWDYTRCRNRHRQLQDAKQLSAEVLEDNLPRADSPDSVDYQDIIEHICSEKRTLQTDMHRQYTELMDYYTIWTHQVKTPISSMRLTLQQEDSPLSRRLTGDLFRVEQYVDMALMFLRLDSHASDYVVRECDLDSIVRGAVRKFAGEFINRRLRLDYTPLNRQVLTDEKWLSFVMEQVLSNALKYTPSGGISIFMENDLLCIRDTGIGIAPEDLPRIFERGYTGCNGRQDKKATGIGLYLCKRICENLGHGISVQSDESGTTVLLDLRRNKLELE